uniref:Uncharacterized protein n=1 Tax=Stomoxys calcitrans TaxID=35570 RepID=A0A1I8Q8X0_STOCA
MNWAISNLTGSNRVSRAILVRYSQVPLADAESTPQTPSSSSSKSHESSSSSFAATFLHASRHVPGRAVPRGNNNNNHHPHHHHATATAASSAVAATQISLPLDVEETVTCFCKFFNERMNLN